MTSSATRTSFMFICVLCAVVTVASAAPKQSGADRARIETILAAHDRLHPGLDEYMASVADDFILMPNRGALIEGKAAYRRHVLDFYNSGSIRIRHEVVEVHSFPEVVIARGRAVGTFTAPDGAVSAFETRNLFIFRRLADNKLQVWQIIYNDAA
ncbi:MAG: nuclear transport factor 2 family protein [Pseudomonadota bacterium]